MSVSGATRGRGGAKLGAHLDDAKAQNEFTLMGESRGLVSDGIRGQIQEISDMAAHARSQKPLYHVHVDPDQSWSPEGWDRYWQRFETEFGLEKQAFAESVHIKHGREHRHRVYSLVQPDGTCIRMDHDFARREKLGRIAEIENGERLNLGRHNRAAMAALEAEGRHDVAAAMREAGMHTAPRPEAPLSPRERAQMDRTGVDPREVGAKALAAWQASDDGRSFRAALAEQGLRLAQGNKVAVIVDAAGGTHPLAKVLGKVSKAAGEERIAAADIERRLEGITLEALLEGGRGRRRQFEPVAPRDSEPTAPAPVAIKESWQAEDSNQPTQDSIAPAVVQAEPVAPDALPIEPVAPVAEAPVAAPWGGAAPAGASGGASAAVSDSGNLILPPDLNNPGDVWRFLRQLQAKRERDSKAAAKLLESGETGGQKPQSVVLRTLFNDYRQAVARSPDARAVVAADPALRAELARFEQEITRDNETAISAPAERQQRTEGPEGPAVDVDAPRRNAPRCGAAGPGEGDHGKRARQEGPDRDAVRDLPGARRHRGSPVGPQNPGHAAGRGVQPDRRDPRSPGAGAGIGAGDARGATGGPTRLGRDQVAVARRHAEERRFAVALAQSQHAFALERIRTRTAALAAQRWQVMDPAERDRRLSKAHRHLSAMYRNAGPGRGEWGAFLAVHAKADPATRELHRIQQADVEAKERLRQALEESRQRNRAMLGSARYGDPKTRDRDEVAWELRERLASSLKAEREAAKTKRKEANAARTKVGFFGRLLRTEAHRTAERLDEEAQALERQAELAKEEYPRKARDEDKRAHGLARARQAEHEAWERKPDVRRAYREEHGNNLVEKAIRDGDREIERLAQQDLEHAREEMLRREQVEQRRRDEENRRRLEHEMAQQMAGYVLGVAPQPGCAGGATGPRGPR